MTFPVTEKSGHGTEDKPFSYKDSKSKKKNCSDMFPDIKGINEHSHGSKKYQTENIAQGQNVAQGLIGITRLTEHHPGHKGPEGEGQTERMGGGNRSQVRWRCMKA